MQGFDENVSYHILNDCMVHIQIGFGGPNKWLHFFSKKKG